MFFYGEGHGVKSCRYWLSLVTLSFLSFFSFSSIAAPIAESVTGEVTVTGAGRSFALQVGQVLENGFVLASKQGASALIRFDDGQVIVLAAASVLKLDDYRYSPAKPAENRSEVELVRGAMRFVSGLLGKQTPGAVKIKTQTATIGIRGTDFMIATGSLYVTVGEGGVTLTNATGTYVLNPGTMWQLASPQAVPTAITVQQLPASISSYFQSLQAIQISGVALPNVGVPGYQVTQQVAGALSLPGGATLGGLSLTPIGVVAAGAAAAVAVSAGEKNTTGTTGTVSAAP